MTRDLVIITGVGLALWVAARRGPAVTTRDDERAAYGPGFQAHAKTIRELPCCDCGRTRRTITVDHITRKAYRHPTPGNLRPRCRPCHARRTVLQARLPWRVLPFRASHHWRRTVTSPQRVVRGAARTLVGRGA